MLELNLWDLNNFQAEQETLRNRIQECSQTTNDLQTQIADLQRDNAESAVLNASEQNAKENVLEAKANL